MEGKDRWGVGRWRGGGGRWGGEEDKEEEEDEEEDELILGEGWRWGKGRSKVL